jgi:UDP-glucose 4-epimerase
VHVSDVAKSNILAMEAETTGECYNVGRGIGTSIKDLTKLLLRLSNSRLEIAYEPEGLTFVTNRIGCTAKAKRDLGFEWSVDLEVGMSSLIDWRRSEQAALDGKRMAVGGVTSL